MKRKSVIISVVAVLVVAVLVAIPIFASKSKRDEGIPIATERKPKVLDSCGCENGNWPYKQGGEPYKLDEENEAEPEEAKDEEVETVASSEDKKPQNSPITTASSKVEGDELDYLPEESDALDPTHEVDPSYTSPEDEEPDPTHEVEAETWCDCIPIVEPEEEEIGPPIAPPDDYSEETTFIAPIETDSKPLG